MTQITARDNPAPVADGELHVTVLTDRCAGCEECVVRCPVGALSMDPARWVAVPDHSLCVGCRQCERTCPFSAITVRGPLAVAARNEPEHLHLERPAGDNSEVRRGLGGWDEALAEANRCLDCPDPTCVRGCPAHNDIPSFIRAIRDRDLASAHDVLRRTSVLPDVCSRVCDQATQCEGACTWSLAGGEPVAIGKLERFIADNAPIPAPERGRVDAEKLSVAIVGSGPAGIAAAWLLTEADAAVTVYERDSEPGGLIAWGIPDFTLPPEVSARPWQQLTAAGVDLRCGTEISAEDVDGLLAAHDAVILAHGATMPLRLPVPGANLDGVVDATSFLKAGKAALEQGDPVGFLESYELAAPEAGEAGAPPNVLVLGAGNTAMDIARTARRLGLRAVCVDWVDERFALARPDEIAEARAEGVEIRFLRTVSRLEGEDDRVRRAALTRTRQRRADRRPTTLSDAPEMLDVDLVVMAMGYRLHPALASMMPGTPLSREAHGLPDRRWMASGIFANPAPKFAHGKPVGELALGREAGLTASALQLQERLWAAGDALVGPATVVEAMAQGRRAAASVLVTNPSRGERRAPRNVLIAYESRGGNTARAAQSVAERLRCTDAVVRTLPLRQVTLAELTDTDLLIVGTWVEGLVVTRVQAASATRSWLDGLPRLPGLRAAIFCTFAVSPRQTLMTMRHELEERGMKVLAEGSFGPGVRNMASSAGRFSENLLAAAWPSGVLI